MVMPSNCSNFASCHTEGLSCDPGHSCILVCRSQNLTKTANAPLATSATILVCFVKHECCAVCRKLNASEAEYLSTGSSVCYSSSALDPFSTAMTTLTSLDEHDYRTRDNGNPAYRKSVIPKDAPACWAERR